MKIILSVFLVCSMYFGLSAQGITVSSPNGKLVSKITIDINISCTLVLNEIECLRIDQMELVGENGSWFGEKLMVKKPTITHEKHDFHPPVPTKVSHIDDSYNELEIKLTRNQILRLRLYNDGMAYRFETAFDNNKQIVDEKMTLMFPDGMKSLFPYSSGLISTFEPEFYNTDISAIKDTHFCVLPVLFYNNNCRILFTENDLFDYPAMFLEKKGKGFVTKFPKVPSKLRQEDKHKQIVVEEYPYIAKTKGTRSFPWRVFLVGEDDKQLLNSTFMQALSSPSAIDDYSWVKPGIVMWDWWNASNIYDVDFRAGMNNDTYKYFIDVAAKLGVPYIMIDEGWSETIYDVIKIVPEIDISEIVNYGKNNGVDVLLWMYWKGLYDNIDNVLDKISDMGVKGIKVDFFDRADQDMLNIIEEIASEAAERELLVDYHGISKPSGLRFKYPNVITIEGVMGAESSKWENTQTPEHHINLMYTRNMVGPMDYTPGALTNYHKKEFKPIFNRPTSIGTRSHQVALFILFESPLQMMCDAPTNYLKEFETANYISKSPVVWDDMLILDATIGQNVVVARKANENWYIGAINNEEKYLKEFKLDFLEAGKSYDMTIFKDGINADRHAEDYIIQHNLVNMNHSVLIEMIAAGGWSAHIIVKSK